MLRLKYTGFAVMHFCLGWFLAPYYREWAGVTISPFWTAVIVVPFSLAIYLTGRLTWESTTRREWQESFKIFLFFFSIPIIPIVMNQYSLASEYRFLVSGAILGFGIVWELVKDLGFTKWIQHDWETQ